MRRFTGAALVAILAFGLSACAGDDDDDAQADQKDDTEEPADEPSEAELTDQYVDALTKASLSNEDRPAGFTEEVARCVAEGTVEIVGIDALQAAELQPSDLETSGALEPLGAPKDDWGPASLALAKKCKAIAPLAEAFGAALPGSDIDAACMENKIDSDEGGVLLAYTLVDQDPTLPVARTLVDFIAECGDLGGLVVAGMTLPLTGQESSCLKQAFSGSEQVRDLITRSAAGQPANKAESDQVTGPIIANCITFARRIELGLVDTGAE